MKKRIAEIIEKENLTSAKFATILGIQPSAVSHILSGRNNPSLDVAQKILNTFRMINPDWLILGVGSMYRETGEQVKKQIVEYKINKNTSQMPSLFPDDTEEITEYRKEIKEKAPSEPKYSMPLEDEEKNIQNKKEINDVIHNNEQTEQTILPASSHFRIVKKIIVYYSDNTYEEYNAQLTKD